MAIDQVLCACGSGLRAVRCCRLDLSQLPSPEASRPLKPLTARAVELFGKGTLEEAEKLCLEVLELAPGEIEALSTLYRIRKAGKQDAAASALLRRIVALYPNTFWATNELALSLLGKSALAEAEIHARNAVRLAPENPQSHYLMGMVMTEANRPQVGEYHYRRVLQLTQRREPVLLANLAWNLKNQGKMAEARSLYEESAAAAPKVLNTLLGWARMEEADRDYERASALVKEAEDLAPANPSVRLSRAVIFERNHEYAEALSVLDSIPAASGNGSLGANEMLEKGRLLDKLGRYEEAFAAYREGKRLCREGSGLSYLGDQAQQLAGRLKKFFTESRLGILPRAGVRAERPQPIFILGFPRSGTTLVEQMLSAHPNISAGDELPIVNELVNALPRMLPSPLAYPEALAELWMGDRFRGLEALRDYYLDRVGELGIVEEGARWFTDKMPLNETHLGLIALIFPQAPLIHVLRHPLDTVLSTFSNFLTHGFYCSYALDTAARHYRLVHELVAHYRSQMTLRYLPVRYEDIVADQERSARRMLDFIGEPFDERCLRFHENRRYARTASYAQVTEPLYERARYRYRHYLKEMEELMPILEGTIRQLGYPLA